MADNTLFLRLTGPMQAWGTSSKFQLRRTDLYPSKSGVLGLLLAARGVRRSDSHRHLPELNELMMGVRIDASGVVGQDYHTAGAKIGIRQPKDGKIKYTASTKLPEVQLSRRQYLFGASFLVALLGKSETVALYAEALQSPVWPPFLGRKSCIPSVPVFAGTGQFDNLIAALESKPYPVMKIDPDPSDGSVLADLECWIESPDKSNIEGSREVYDTPQRFGYWNYLPRRIVKTTVTVPLKYLVAQSKDLWKDPYGPEWTELREARLEFDGYQCIFCQSPATQVHHIDYENVSNETLRSLCELCHDACTMLEYARGDKPIRVDPSDPAQCEELLEQIERILAGRKKQRRRKLLQGQ